MTEIWKSIKKEGKILAEEEPALQPLIYQAILNQNDLAHSIAFILAGKFKDDTMSAITYNHIFLDAMKNDKAIIEKTRADLAAIKERDPACDKSIIPLLYFKGFQAIKVARVSHNLWNSNRKTLAYHLQSKNSEIFGVDIHPGAKIGHGLLLDHATSFVAGETAVIGNNVSILHEVTLGGSGNECGDRHPKIDDGVLIGAGAKLLGNIHIGEGAKIGAGSVVITDIAAHCTAVGIPAQVVGTPNHESPAKFMDQFFMI